MFLARWGLRECRGLDRQVVELLEEQLNKQVLGP